MSLIRRGIATVAAALIATGVTAALPPTASAATPAPPTVTADVLPTWQTNGIVWTTASIGNTVFVGGTFTSIRPPGSAAGSGEQARQNFAAFNATTGAPLACAPSFTRSAGGATVRAMTISPDGRTLYVGGLFNAVGGASGWNQVAAVDIASCAVSTSFRPQASSTVRALAATGSSVYFGGDFVTVNGQARRYLASATPAGALTPWTATADRVVRALLVAQGGATVLAGGDFFDVSGSQSHALVGLDATSGAVVRTFDWIEANSVTKHLSTDGTNFYLSAEGTGGGVFDGKLAGRMSDLSQVWVDRCLGATQATIPMGGILYAGHHHHNCSSTPGGWPELNSRQHLTAHDVRDTEIQYWYPNTNGGLGEQLGPRTLTATNGILWLGGEFTRVNEVGQQGLARFAYQPDTGAPDTPAVSASSLRPGEAVVRWRSSVDLDNETLTYNVYRNGSSTPVYTASGKSHMWLGRPQMSFRDTNVTNGQSYQYRVTASDGTNVSPLSAVASVTVATTASAYAGRILDDGATAYWRLGETSGNVVADSAGDNGATARGGYTRNVTPGALVNDTNRATSFNGVDGFTSGDSYSPSPSVYSVEAWFRTSSTSGGKIVGFGDGRTGNSGNYDKHIWMTNDGQLRFGVWNGRPDVVESRSGLNNDQWHHVVASQGPSGMAMFVDGELVGRNTVTTNQPYSGVWKIGGDNLNGWPTDASSSYFAGSVDEVAVYPSVLSTQKVIEHYTASGRTLPDDTVAPEAPTGVSASHRGTQTTVRWVEAVDNRFVASYRIHRGTTPDFTVSASNVVATSTTTESVITGLPEGMNYLKVVAVDGAGNVGPPSEAAVVRVTAPPSDTYGAAVYGDSPSIYYRLDETSGTTAFDSSGNGRNGTYDNGVLQGMPGALPGNAGANFDGVDDGIHTNDTFNNPRNFSLEAWFQTTSNNGGKIIGFGSSPTGGSGGYDRHVFLSNDGRMTFGVWTGFPNTINTAQAVNDGKWHHVVATQSSVTGMALYLDGRLVGTNGQTEAQDYTGYWRVGGDNHWGCCSGWLAGSIDEVAVYDRAIPAGTVGDHFRAGGGDLPVNTKPVASFTTSCTTQACVLDGRGSSDADGSIASYAWDLGDGTTSTASTVDHTYASPGTRTVTLVVKDDQGASSDPVSHDVTPSAPPTPADAYGRAVQSDRPATYWRLDDSTGSTTADSGLTGNPGGVSETVTRGVPGIPGAAGKAARTAGTFGSGVIATRPVDDPRVYSLETWFSTTTTAGGKLIGFGRSNSGESSNYDRHVWMRDDGSLAFGTYTGALNVITSAAGLNDGQWHHLVATQGPDGMKLYVDGTLVGADPQTGAEPYTGYWRIGGDTTWGGNSSNWIDASFDEVAIYTTVLPAARVTEHHRVGAATEPVNELPTASFTDDCTFLACTLDGSGSSDSDGTVVGHAWQVEGVGSRSGATTSVTFPAAGSYDVTLTVTDDKGATRAVTRTLTVTAPPPNEPPTARLTVSCTGMTCAADGRTSSDGDGTITDYAWSFGDGGTATGSTASHTYTGAGTFTVRLTVTDDDGDTGTATATATPTAPAPPQTVSLVATADGYAHSANASLLTGTHRSMLSDGSPTVTAFTRFALPAAPAGTELLSATLRVRTVGTTTAPSVDSLSVRSAANSWDESTLNWTTRPATEAASLGSVGSLPATNTAYEITLDKVAIAALLGQDRSFALVSGGGDAVELHTRESTTVAARPTLVLTFGVTP
ncbi:LamG-like jellyroll fold domain-containing protein [Knoellia sp. LjRoot47]|uniref:LamG-like jellyroll fold domain-containing protein n=1 Tax=Knoellia sp. LjRoot47 TaxID=3342330 RepID=UPI003ECECB74